MQNTNYLCNYYISLLQVCTGMTWCLVSDTRICKWNSLYRQLGLIPPNQFLFSIFVVEESLCGRHRSVTSKL